MVFFKPDKETETPAPVGRERAFVADCNGLHLVGYLVIAKVCLTGLC